MLSVLRKETKSFRNGFCVICLVLVDCLSAGPVYLLECDV